MKKGKQHISSSASKRGFSILRPKQVVSGFVAFFLAFSLFPVYAFAESDVLTTGSGESTTTTQASTVASSAVSTSAASSTESTTNVLSTGAQAQGTSENLPSVYSDAVVETITIGTTPLNLIQSGNYVALENPTIASSYASATTPTTEQRNQIKARLNQALATVSYGTYNSQSNWCIVDVSDIQAPMYSNATAYAKTLVEEVINENPDIFYAGASYGGGTSISYSSSGSSIILSKVLVQYYYTPSSISSMKTKYETAMQNVLSWVKPNSSEAEKAKAVHDWLVRNCIYNYAAYEKRGPTAYGSWDPWSAYGAVVNKKPVCEGYSLAFMAAMQRLGIEATFVTNSGHGWNRVKLNGSWYNLDITYDDPVSSSNHYSDGGYSQTPSTTYFLKSDAKFKTLGTVHAKWTPAGVSGTSTTYDGTWTGNVYPISNSTMTVTSLSISPSAFTLATNSSQKLSLNAGGSNIDKALVSARSKWTSSNTSVATVDSTGTVSSGSKTGTATITVTYNNSRSATCTVTVKQVSMLNKATVSLAPSVQQSTINQYGSDKRLRYVSGQAHRPKLSVVYGSTLLTEGTDYAITWPSDTINPGTKTATLVGKGEYAGSTTFNYLVGGDISSTSLSASTITVPYTGTVPRKAPTVTFKGSLNKTITLVEGTDFTVTYPSSTTVGSKTAIITGRGAWSGSKTYTIKITPAQLSSSAVTVSVDATKNYTGKAVANSPTVKVNGTVLAASNYTVSYKNNTKVGTATITIVGKNYVNGTITKTFTILPPTTKITKVTAAKKGFTVKWKKQTKQTKGYQIQYSLKKNFKSGVKTVTIKKNKTTSRKITKLKSKKTYYVRIRTFSKVGGKTYYSSWSATKKVKTK